MPNQSLRRPLLAAALALLCLASSGCVYFAAGTTLGAVAGVASSARPAGGGIGAWRPDAAVSIDFSPARDVAARAPGESDTLRVRDVTRLVGRVRSMRGDSSWIAITELRRLGRPPLAFAARREPVTVVRSGDVARAQVITSRATATQRGIVGGAIGFVLVYLGFVAYCAREQCVN